MIRLEVTPENFNSLTWINLIERWKQEGHQVISETSFIPNTHYMIWNFYIEFPDEASAALFKLTYL